MSRPEHIPGRHRVRLHDGRALPLWLGAALYRMIADPECQPIDRDRLVLVFNDIDGRLINSTLDAMINYGAITETQNGDDWPLEVVPYEEG